jgi:hypothetical protein
LCTAPNHSLFKELKTEIEAVAEEITGDMLQKTVGKFVVRLQ